MPAEELDGGELVLDVLVAFVEFPVAACEVLFEFVVSAPLAPPI